MRTVIMSLPPGIDGFAVRYFDASYGDFVYTIIISDALSYDAKRTTYMHEVEHIVNGDFECHSSVDTVEYLRHSYG